MDEEENYEFSILINRILSGIYYFELDNKNYYQINPTSKLRSQADFLYSKIYNSNLYSDSFISEKTLKNILIANNIIDKDYDSQLSKITKQLDSLKINLYKRYRERKFREFTKEEIAQKKHSIAKMTYLRHSLDFLLLSSFCNKIKTEYILCNTIYYADSNELVFDHNNLDSSYFNKIMNYLNNDELKSLDIFKKLSRSSYWKNIWSCDKSNIFNSPISEWSEEQRAIVNISKMYDSIYEHPECPIDEIIEDGDALDGWILFQKLQSLKEKKEKGVDNSTLGKNKNAQNVFLMADTDEEAREIIDANSWDNIQKFKKDMKKEFTHEDFIKKIDEINKS